VHYQPLLTNLMNGAHGEAATRQPAINVLNSKGGYQSVRHATRLRPIQKTAQFGNSFWRLVYRRIACGRRDAAGAWRVQHAQGLERFEMKEADV
jgi:hypothetical protein